MGSCQWSHSLSMIFSLLAMVKSRPDELGVAAVRAAALHKIQALATVIVGKDGASKQASRRRASKAAQQARADSYFNQHSFYADDLPRGRSSAQWESVKWTSTGLRPVDVHLKLPHRTQQFTLTKTWQQFLTHTNFSLQWHDCYTLHMMLITTNMNFCNVNQWL